MLYKILVMFSIICLLSACAPSQKALQAALAQTQTSEKLAKNIVETGEAQTQIAENNNESILKTGIAQTQAAWTPTLMATKTRNPYFLSTITPKHVSYFNKTLQMDCLFWEKVDQSMVGKTICVYGKITSQLWQYNGMYYYFADDGSSFYVISLKQGSEYYYYPKAEDGVCIQEVGVIKSYLGILRMEAEGAIQYWSSELYNCY
jgi:hypothetical protein